MKKSLRGALLLLFTSVIWGGAFVSQQIGGDLLDPLWFNGVRIMLAGLLLLGCIPLFVKIGLTRASEPGEWRRLIREGVICGLALFLATNLQQLGLQQTTVAKSGFISALYVIFVPLAGLLFGRGMPWHRWVCVAGAAVGLYLLCMENSFVLTRGDLYELLCAICFAAQIMLVGKYGAHSEGMRLSSVEFLTAGALTLLMAALARPGRLTAEGLRASLSSILYSGILSCGVGYTLQTLAQRDLSPTIASLIMSLESVFALVAGVLLLGETLTGRQLCGSALMLVCVMAAQLPGKAERAAGSTGNG